MPAVSKKQRKLFGMASAYKSGKLKPSEVSDEVKKLAKSMTKKELDKYATTKESGLKESLVDMIYSVMEEMSLSENDIVEDALLGNTDAIPSKVLNTTNKTVAPVINTGVNDIANNNIVDKENPEPNVPKSRYAMQIRGIKNNFRKSEFQQSLRQVVASLKDFDRKVTQFTTDIDTVKDNSMLVSTNIADLQNRLKYLLVQFNELTSAINKDASK